MDLSHALRTFLCRIFSINCRECVYENGIVWSCEVRLKLDELPPFAKGLSELPFYLMSQLQRNNHIHYVFPLIQACIERHPLPGTQLFTKPFLNVSNHNLASVTRHGRSVSTCWNAVHGVVVSENSEFGVCLNPFFFRSQKKCNSVRNPLQSASICSNVSMPA